MAPKTAAHGLGGLAVLAVIVAFVLVYFQPQKLFIDDHVNETIPAAGRVAERRVVLCPASTGLKARRRSTGSMTAGGSCASRTFTRATGPALVVYLSANPADGREGAFDDTYVDLGGLKGNIGGPELRDPGRR